MTAIQRAGLSDPLDHLLAELGRVMAGAFGRMFPATFRWTTGRIRAKESAEEAAIQLLVDPPEQVLARDVVGREAKAGEHHDQDDPVPNLETPANGSED